MEKKKKEERKNQKRFPLLKLKKMLTTCFCSNRPNSKNGPSSNFVCEICVEESKWWFRVEGCGHSYCTDCITKYVSSKLLQQQGNVRRRGRIGCPVPGCGGYLEQEYCRRILPREVLDRWGNAQCEAAIARCQKFYCPFKDCSVVIICDGKEKTMMKSACPNCRRFFCAKCKAPWHSGIVCSKFQRLNEKERHQDKLLNKLANKKGWETCPNCRIYIDKIGGCNRVTCRCGRSFNYKNES